MNEYISLGFSYLTFVMLEKLNKGDKTAQENEFDPEPYNYLFNKSTVFIDSAFVYKDHKRLGTILNKF